MATAKKNVQVVEKNTGTKIDWKQSGNKLIFGDDDLSIRCDTRQRDLVIGVGKGRYYVAQVEIPPIAYVETEIEAAEGEDAMDGENRNSVKREALPLDMSEVTLTLWSMDDLPLAKQ